jgi:cation/acetate symporter
VASLKPADILPLVAASFSLAAAAFVPVMVLGIFWRGTTRSGAVAGMLAGLGTTVLYMVVNAEGVRALFGLAGRYSLWFGILPAAAGVFGVAVGVLVAIAVSLLSRQGASLPRALTKAAGTPPR